MTAITSPSTRGHFNQVFFAVHNGTPCVWDPVKNKRSSNRESKELENKVTFEDPCFVAHEH